MRRDRSKAFPAIAPSSIFPLPESECVALSLGWLFYRTILNLDVIAAAFKREGFSLRTPGGGPGTGGTFLIVDGPGGSMDVPSMLAEQMLIELLTVSSFVAATRNTFGRPDDAKASRLNVGIAWREEERVWR